MEFQFSGTMVVDKEQVVSSEVKRFCSSATNV